jgi:hypothetical protein
LDISDNAYQINVLDSTHFDPKEYANCDIPFEDTLQVPVQTLPGLNMYDEQSRDPDISEITKLLIAGTGDKAVQRKHILIDNVVYFISDPDNNATLRLYVPAHLRSLVVTQYHDDNGHMGVQKTYDAIKLKYYWPNLYKELYVYVTRCTTCQTRSLQKVKPPLQETEIPPYPMAKLSLDVSGPYPVSMS